MKTRNARVLAAILALSAGVHLQAISYKGHEYFLTTAATTWAAAEAEAVGLGGHLVAINDAAEALFIDTHFGKTQLWIGLNDIASEGNFVWTSGEPVTYVDWNPGEPNNMGNEDVVIFWPGSGGTYDWNDVPTSYSGWKGIIERPVPEVCGSILLLAMSIVTLLGIQRCFQKIAVLSS